MGKGARLWCGERSEIVVRGKKRDCGAGKGARLWCGERSEIVLSMLTLILKTNDQKMLKFERNDLELRAVTDY